MSDRFRFFFHYNKPASKKAGRPQITVHARGVCHLVDNVRCFVSTEGKRNKRQPFFVMQGWARDLTLRKQLGQTVAEIS